MRSSASAALADTAVAAAATVRLLVSSWLGLSHISSIRSPKTAAGIAAFYSAR